MTKAGKIRKSCKDSLELLCNEEGKPTEDEMEIEVVQVYSKNTLVKFHQDGVKL